MKAAAAIELALQLIDAAARLGQLVRQARAEGREDLTDDELQAVVADNDAARAQLVAAINRAS